MNEVINLNNLSGIPLELLSDLEKHTNIFRSTEFSEEIFENPKIASVVSKIHDYCNERSVVGYHYTNAVPEEIITNGLMCRSGHDIRSVFLKNYHQLFTEQELQSIKAAWEREFNTRIQAIRDNRLYFNYTTKELGRRGSELLLNYYGGEQVYWPLYTLENIRSKIKNIGTAMMLKCSLSPKNLKTYSDNSFGKVAISTYHFMLNPCASRYDEDGNQNVDVKPENIEIIYPDKFKNYDKI